MGPQVLTLTHTEAQVNCWDRTMGVSQSIGNLVLLENGNGVATGEQSELERERERVEEGGIKSCA